MLTIIIVINNNIVILYTSLFSRYKFRFFQKVNFVGTYFRGCYFCGYESSWLADGTWLAHGFVYSAVMGYNELYNQYKEILEAIYREKEKFSIFLLLQWWKIEK